MGNAEIEDGERVIPRRHARDSFGIVIEGEIISEDALVASRSDKLLSGWSFAQVCP